MSDAFKEVVRMKIEHWSKDLKMKMDFTQNEFDVFVDQFSAAMPGIKEDSLAAIGAVGFLMEEKELTVEKLGMEKFSSLAVLTGMLVSAHGRIVTQGMSYEDFTDIFMDNLPENSIQEKELKEFLAAHAANARSMASQMMAAATY